MTGINEFNIGLVIPAAILSPVAIITGLSSLLGWWFRGLFNLKSVEGNGNALAD